MKIKILFALTLISLLSFYFYFTKIETNIKPHYAFYHWQQTYKVTGNTAPKYIKVLDIAHETKTTIHLTKFTTKPRAKIVPVIYIEHLVFKQINAEQFAKKIFLLLKKQAKNTFSYDEVQIDCDWTNSTRSSYFTFLKAFKKRSNKILSTTIRLHQIKYQQRTGVPPVDKGVLMYYNMANFKDLNTKNYILDLVLAKKYHYNFDTYPLALDLALPLYAQATIIRFEEVVGIMEGVRKKDLTKNFKALKNNQYEVLKTHYFKKRLLYEGDILRIDEVSIQMLQEAVHNLGKVMKQPKKIIFYRWGNKKEYPQKELENLHLFF